MRRWCCSIVLSLPALSAAADTTGLEALLEAEARFAADVVELGLREAYLHHLIEESVVFRPLPVSARSWFEQQEPPPFTLSWRPAFVEVAGSGDFGYTIGVWESRTLPDLLPLEEYGDDAEAGAAVESISHGYYATVWIQTADGQWHPLVDHGIGGLPRPDTPASVQPLGARRSNPIDGSFLLNTRYQGLMRDAMRLPAGQAAANVDRGWLADDLLVLRPGRAPISGHEAVRLVASGELGAAAPDLIVMAASGDLGMSLGGSPDAGAYLRLWRHLDGAGWLLAVEIATPVERMVDGEDSDSDSEPRPTGDDGGAGDIGDIGDIEDGDSAVSDDLAPADDPDDAAAEQTSAP